MKHNKKWYYPAKADIYHNEVTGRNIIKSDYGNKGKKVMKKK